MNDWVGNIFYFGSPKDGFKVYPDLGESSNAFSGYYSNTETDWVLIARKAESITRYTYVRYGLLTSLVDGRTGSCFGISIDFVNQYFTDLKVFQKEIFEGIWGAILDDGQLLEAQEFSKKVAFRSYDLYDVAPYLDEMSKKIREVISDKKYSNHVRPSYEIPQAGDKVYGLHPDSSSSAIIEYFRTYGAIKLSPKLPIETKSASEKQEAHRENLEREVGELTEQLRKKNRELQALNQKLEVLQGLVKPIRDFSFGTATNETQSDFGKSQRVNQTYEPLSPANHKTSYSETAVCNPSHKHKLSTNTKRILGIVIAFLLLIGAIYFWSGERKPEAENTQPFQPASQTKATSPSPGPLLIVRKNSREVGLLNESVFFEQAGGVTIFDEGDLKEVLTSFLFRFSPEVLDIYKGNKDELWRQILELNPNNRKKFTQYLKERAPFKIERNADQQAILKELVVFIKSS